MCLNDKKVTKTIRLHFLTPWCWVCDATKCGQQNVSKVMYVPSTLMKALNCWCFYPCGILRVIMAVVQHGCDPPGITACQLPVSFPLNPENNLLFLLCVRMLLQSPADVSPCPLPQSPPVRPNKSPTTFSLWSEGILHSSATLPFPQ